jgi:hypothetical protein
MNGNIRGTNFGASVFLKKVLLQLTVFLCMFGSYNVISFSFNTNCDCFICLLSDLTHTWCLYLFHMTQPSTQLAKDMLLGIMILVNVLLVQVLIGLVTYIARAWRTW